MPDFNIAAQVTPPQPISLAPLAQLSQMQMAQTHGDLYRAQADEKARFLTYGPQYVDALLKGDNARANLLAPHIGNIETAQKLLDFVQKGKGYEALAQFNPNDPSTYTSVMRTSPENAERLGSTGLKLAETAGKVQDVQQRGRTIGALNQFDPTKPETMTPLFQTDPEQALKITGAQKNTAETGKTVADTQSERLKQLGSIGNMALAAIKRDAQGTMYIDPQARDQAIGAGLHAGVINQVQAESYRTMSPQAWAQTAQTLVAGGQSGQQFAETTGAAAGNQARAKAPFETVNQAPGETVWTKGGLAGLGAGNVPTGPTGAPFVPWNPAGPAAAPQAPMGGAPASTPPAIPMPQPRPMGAPQGAVAPPDERVPNLPLGPQARINTGFNGIPPAPVVPGKTPLQMKEAEALGKDLGELPAALDAKAGEAKQNNNILDQMRLASTNFPMGKGAAAIRIASEYIKPVANAFGDHSFDSAVDNWGDFNKNVGQLVRSAVKDTSSRASFQEFSMIQRSMPNEEMSRGGFHKIADQIQSVNDYHIARQQAGARWFQEHGESMQGFRENWNANASPSAFLFERMSKEDRDTVISQMSKTVEGRVALKNIGGQIEWARKNDLIPHATVTPQSPSDL